MINIKAVEAETYIKIALKAILADNATRKRKYAKSNLVSAYFNWKQNNGYEYVQKDSKEWKRMMLATKKEYNEVVETKRLERNAKRNLETAINRFYREGFSLHKTNDNFKSKAKKGGVS